MCENAVGTRDLSSFWRLFTRRPTLRVAGVFFNSPENEHAESHFWPEKKGRSVGRLALNQPERQFPPNATTWLQPTGEKVQGGKNRVRSVQLTGKCQQSVNGLNSASRFGQGGRTGQWNAQSPMNESHKVNGRKRSEEKRFNGTIL